MKSRKYTDEQLQEAVETSYSIRAVLQKLGLTPANALHNIELLCPNCHALTDNYRGGKKKV